MTTPRNLLVVRHGNTFREGERPVWVGGVNDPELTETGVAQARLLGREISSKYPTVRAVYHGPLRRTARTAHAIVSAFGTRPPLVVSECLRELDYGQWTGLSNEEITREFGAAELVAWQQHASWPTAGRWVSTYESVAMGLRHWLDGIGKVLEEDGDVIAVTSNGVARELLRACGVLDSHLACGVCPKLRTGAYGVLRRVSGSYEVASWDIVPLLDHEGKM